MPLSRELPEVLEYFADGLLEGIRKNALGIVTAVNGKFVDVQVAVNSPLFDEFSGTSFEAAPVIGNVPIGVLRAGGFICYLPLAVGDTVMLHFTDLSTDSWRVSNGSQPVNPGFVGRHTADSCYALPYGGPDSQALPEAGGGRAVLGISGGNQISVSASDIQLGGTHGIARGDKVDAFIQAVMSWVPSAGDGGAALKAALSGAGFSVSSSVASTVVKSA